MKKVNFVVTDLLNQKIEEVMSRLGFNNKSEFFRMLAHNYIKEVKAPQRPGNHQQSQKSDETLTEKEKTTLRNLQKESQSIDTLIGKTGLSISEISVVLLQLQLKDLVVQKGAYWTIKENLDFNE